MEMLLKMTTQVEISSLCGVSRDMKPPFSLL